MGVPCMRDSGFEMPAAVGGEHPFVHFAEGSEARACRLQVAFRKREYS